MTVLNAAEYNNIELLKRLDELTNDNIEIINVNGERYIGCGLKKKNLIIRGTAGNNLAAFSEEIRIALYGNGQEGVANTMSDGEIIVHGRVGDIAGYAMRGGCLYIRDDVGYRLGIHMKSYQDKKPVIVVGGSVGAFAGEYMAGGIIIVLGLNKYQPLIGHYCGTGMYAGSIYLRGEFDLRNIAANVKIETVDAEQMAQIIVYLEQFSNYFGYSLEKILTEPFTRLSMKVKRPFAHLYTGFVS
ncbi:MAG: hypothetical protein GX550_04825 [Syntrophomonadaceae bacterium]|nr:hypothetical protein [Syntrophomonadaceae bacterium]